MAFFADKLWAIKQVKAMYTALGHCTPFPNPGSGKAHFLCRLLKILGCFPFEKMPSIPMPKARIFICQKVYLLQPALTTKSKICSSLFFLFSLFFLGCGFFSYHLGCRQQQPSTTNTIDLPRRIQNSDDSVLVRKHSL